MALNKTAPRAVRNAPRIAALPPRRRGTGRGSTVAVVERLAAIFTLFTGGIPELHLRDVTSTVGLQRSTAHRYLTSLVRAGLLRQVRVSTYGLGPLLIQLGATAVGALRVVNLGESYLHRLVEEAGETAVMSIWGGHGPVVVRVREPLSKLIQIRVPVGAPLPITSAQGMVFLAWHRDATAVRRLLDQLAPAQRTELVREIKSVRLHKVAISAQVVDGIRTVAVPVFDHETVAATLAFVGTTAAISADPNSGLVAGLKEAAALLSRELGYAGGRVVQADEGPLVAESSEARRSGMRSDGGADRALGLGRVSK
jgi:DNA-binding IclR family transcriptional regulator